MTLWCRDSRAIPTCALATIGARASGEREYTYILSLKDGERGRKRERDDERDILARALQNGPVLMDSRTCEELPDYFLFISSSHSTGCFNLFPRELYRIISTRQEKDILSNNCHKNISYLTKSAGKFLGNKFLIKERIVSASTDGVFTTEDEIIASLTLHIFIGTSLMKHFWIHI